MSVRVGLSVVFTVALVAAVLPAVEDARTAERDAAAERAATAVLETAEALVEAGAPPPSGTPGARRTIRIDVPASTALTIENGSPVLRTRIDSGTTGTWTLPVRVWTAEWGLDLSGRTVLTISYERRGGTPVLVVARGFMSEAAAKKGYATDSGVPRGRVRPSKRQRPLRMYG